MKILPKGKGVLVLMVVLSLVAGLIMANWAGTAGGQDPAGAISGTISGAVTNSLTGSPLSAAKVTTDPAIEGVSIKTDAKGNYTATLPIGIYTLTFEKTNFESSTQMVVAIGGQTAIKNVSLKPTSAVVVSAGKDQSSSPGKTLTLKATAKPLDGSTVTGYKWTQTAGAAATLENANHQSATVILAGLAAYKAELFEHLDTLDRFMVQGVNPHSLEEAEKATFKITVTTSSGSYSDTVSVMAHLPYVVSIGIQNVSVNVPVLLHGKSQDVYSWILKLPGGSNAVLDDSSAQNPSFTPDVAGKYALSEANSGTALDIYAGTWLGVIIGRDDEGEPVADTTCTTCHNGTMAPDKFSAWKASGHAEIITQNIDNPSGHWSIGCASCHTVGYDTDADNNGFDEIMAREGWEVPHGAVGNWDKMLADYPGTARLANIQCENCHGPQDSAAHMQASMRINISSDVCGSCHGEPPRHGRFQQWEESKHA
ncbi:MAG: carboxypeptidase regulatory-like domain-containing protein, partial [Candidatus Aerophobetes bacterium]